MAINPYGLDPGAGGPRPQLTPWRVYLEDALVLLAIPVLWFTVLRKTGPLVVAAQALTLAVMVAIFSIRTRRMLAARRQAEDEARRL